MGILRKRRRRATSTRAVEPFANAFTIYKGFSNNSTNISQIPSSLNSSLNTTQSSIHSNTPLITPINVTRNVQPKRWPFSGAKYYRIGISQPELTPRGNCVRVHVDLV